jgi:hypothetical protein
MSLRKRNGGMFGEAKNQTLSKIVKIDTVGNARKSTQELLKRFNELQRRDAKVRTKRATVLAANRAAVIAKNTKNPKMKSDKLKIAGMYRKAASKMKL